MVTQLLNEHDVHTNLGDVRVDGRHTSRLEHFGDAFNHGMTCAALAGLGVLVFGFILSILGLISMPLKQKVGWPLFGSCVVLSAILMYLVENWFLARRKFALHQYGLRYNNQAFLFEEIAQILPHGTPPSAALAMPTFFKLGAILKPSANAQFVLRMQTSLTIITSDGQIHRLDRIRQYYQPEDVTEVFRILNQERPGLVRQA